LECFIFYHISTSLPAARFKSSIIVLGNLNLSFASFKIPSILALSSLFFLTDAKNWLNFTFFSSGVLPNSFAVSSLPAALTASLSSSSSASTFLGSALGAFFSFSWFFFRLLFRCFSTTLSRFF